MDGASNGFFARPAFTLDQYRMLAGGNLGDNAIQLLHFGRVSEHTVISWVGLQVLMGDAIFQ